MISDQVQDSIIDQIIKGLIGQGTEERKGYKPKEVQTRMGPLELSVPQVRGVGLIAPESIL